MTQTPRTSIPYPTRGQDPWFTGHEATLTEIDLQSYAYREDRGILAIDGGTFTFSAITGVLSWSASINLTSDVTGFLWEVVAASVNLEDGDYLYLDLPRGPITITAVTPQVAQIVPNTSEAYPLAYRRGSLVYFRQGVLSSGVPLAVLSGGGSTSITVQQAGVSIGTRPIINFVSGALVLDDGFNNRVDVTVTGGGGGGSTGVFSCPGAVAVNDIVYISAGDTVSKANATSLATAPALGVVLAKPSGVTAQVMFGASEVTSFLGLTPGATYYLSTVPGGVTTVPPAAPGNVVQRVGQARNATTLICQFGGAFYVV